MNVPQSSLAATESPALSSTTTWWWCSGATRGEVVSTVINPSIGVVEAGHVQHVLNTDPQGVIATTHQVNALDGLDARTSAVQAATLVGNGTQAQGDICAIEH